MNELKYQQGHVVGIFTKSLPAKLKHQGLTEMFVAGNLAESPSRRKSLKESCIWRKAILIGI